MGGLLILTLPEIFEGLRIMIAISVLVTAEAISRTVPEKALWVRAILDFTPFDRQRMVQIQRIALVDCSCDGSLPVIQGKLSCTKKIPILTTRSALCLDENEQMALREMVQRNSLTRLTITGCNGYPLPVDIRSNDRIQSNSVGRTKLAR